MMTSHETRIFAYQEGGFAGHTVAAGCADASDGSMVHPWMAGFNRLESSSIKNAPVPSFRDQAMLALSDEVYYERPKTLAQARSWLMRVLVKR
jgi:hypothetical protein